MEGAEGLLERTGCGAILLVMAADGIIEGTVGANDLDVPGPCVGLELDVIF